MSRIHHQQFDGGISGSAPFSLSSLFLSLSLSRARRARASRASQIANEPRAAARSPRGRGLELRFIWRTYDGQRSSASRAAHRHRNQGVIPRSSAAAVTSSGNMALFSAAPPGKRALPPRPVARLSARLRRAAAPPLSEKPRLPRDVRPRKHPHPRRLVISRVSSCLSFIRARRAAAGLLSGVRRPEHGARMPPCLLCFRRRRLSSPRTRRPSAPCPATEGRPTAASSASARASARARARCPWRCPRVFERAFGCVCVALSLCVFVFGSKLLRGIRHCRPQRHSQCASRRSAGPPALASAAVPWPCAT